MIMVLFLKNITINLYTTVLLIFFSSQYEIDKLTKNSRTLIKNNYRNKHINSVYKNF